MTSSPGLRELALASALIGMSRAKDFCSSLSSPCKYKDKTGDISDCTRYYSCNKQGHRKRRQCQVGKNFDAKSGECRKKATCCAKMSGDNAENDPSFDIFKSTGSWNNAPDTTDNRLQGDQAATGGPDAIGATEDLSTKDTGKSKPSSQPSTQQTTRRRHKLTPDSPIRVVPTDGEGPKYVIPTNDVTTAGSRELTTAATNSTTAGMGAAPLSNMWIGIIAGASLGFILIIVVIIAVLVCIKRKRRKDDVGTVENPIYRPQNNQQVYRYSRDSALLMEKRTKNNAPENNNSDSKASPRKKGKAPSPPKPESSPLLQKPSPTGSAQKRRAPAPPNPFTGEVEEPLIHSDDHIYAQPIKKAERIEMSTFSTPKKQEAPHMSETISPYATSPLRHTDEAEKRVHSDEEDFELDNAVLSTVAMEAIKKVDDAAGEDKDKENANNLEDDAVADDVIVEQDIQDEADDIDAIVQELMEEDSMAKKADPEAVKELVKAAEAAIEGKVAPSNETGDHDDGEYTEDDSDSSFTSSSNSDDSTSDDSASRHGDVDLANDVMNEVDKEAMESLLDVTNDSDTTDNGMVMNGKIHDDINDNPSSKTPNTSDQYDVMHNPFFIDT